MTRVRAAVLAFSLLVVVVAPWPSGQASAEGASAAAAGRWVLTFTPATVRSIGSGVYRGGVTNEGCSGSCNSAYYFTTPGAGDGRSTKLYITLDASDCSQAPCDVQMRQPAAVASHSTTTAVHFDGREYSGSGDTFFSLGTSGCEPAMPKGTDSIRFRVDPSASPQMTGELTAILSIEYKNYPTCELVGYEIYTGSFTGTPVPGFGPTGTSGPGGAARSANVSGNRVLSKAQVADAVAATTHARPVLSTHVADARDLPWSPKRLLVSALLALVLVALIPFPAELFNSTLHANYAEVRGWFAFIPSRRPPDAVVGAEGQAARRPWLGFLGMVGATALLTAFLDPKLGVDRASVVLVSGLFLSIAAVVLLSAIPKRRYAAEHTTRTQLHVYPLGFAVAAVCVLVSRLTSFEPGYVYGVIAGFGIAAALSDRDKGRLTFTTAVFLLATSVAAFVLRIPVHAATVDSGSTALALLDTVLAAIFAAGVEGNLLGLLPLRFLPGEEVMAWSKRWWAVAFGLSAFAFLHALAARSGTESTGTSVAVAATLFGIFGGVSVAFWAWFRFRRRSGDADTPGRDLALPAEP